MKVWQVLLIILAVLAVAFVILYIVGKRLEKKQAANKEQIEAAKQQVTLLVIDKKKLRVKDSGLPQIVIDQVPKLMRRNKLPIVKVKVGPKIMTMIADDKVFDILPLKKEVKATISGIYITDVKALRGTLPVVSNKKKSFREKIMFWKEKTEKELKDSENSSSGKKNRKK